MKTKRLVEAFDLNKYLKIQKAEILKRVSQFDKKLYLEFGGKLFDDYHASRVLPGFAPDAKLQLLLSLKTKSEIVIVVNAQDINSNKVRNDIGITYEAEVDRLINAFHSVDLSVNGVVLSFYEPSIQVKEYETKLGKMGIKVYRHYVINGYPSNIPLILSEDGLGKNDYIETTKPIVVVTAPGPNSGKMAVCLSQLYHDSIRGIQAGYAKYETFPIWNLPLKHPVNLAYEAATVDIDDVNMIDPYHLEAYGVTAVNYNRDVATFPLLKAIFDKLYKVSPYKSPTDMGVNMAGFAIKNEEAAISASKKEIVRRYYQTRKNIFLGRYPDETLIKCEMLLKEAQVALENRVSVAACLKRSAETGEPCIAIELNNGKIVTGKRSELLGASAAGLFNALKVLGKIDDKIPLLSRSVIDPIIELKVGALRNNNPRIHAEEALVALAIQANNNPVAAIAVKQLEKLKHTQAHSSCILADSDLNTLKKLGIEVTEEPISYVKKINILK